MLLDGLKIDPEKLHKLTYKEHFKKEWKWIVFRWGQIPVVITVYLLIGSAWWIYPIYLGFMIPLNAWVEKMSYLNAIHQDKFQQVKMILESQKAQSV